jgi:hypothetical protein
MRASGLAVSLAPETVGDMSKETEDQKRVPGFADEQAAEFLHPKDAAPRQDNAGKKVLRARPVKGDVDHEALSWEFIARFPKLRAALAK